MAGRFQRAQGRAFAGLDERAWGGSFFFTQLADTQLGLLNANNPTVTWEEELATLHLAIAHFNAVRPRFVVVCGDLTNAMPVGKGANRPLMAQQIRDFKQAMSTIAEDIPLVCCCGNHDLGDLPTRETVRMYNAEYGDDYFTFWVGGCRCVVLNTSLYAARDDELWQALAKDMDPALKPDTLSLAQEQDDWLAAQLAADAAAPAPQHTMVFSHIPPFIFAADEARGYFNLPPHIRDPLVARVRAGGATKWFCGHFHRNASAWAGPLEVVTTSAVGTHIPFAPDVLDAQAHVSNQAKATTLQGMDWDHRQCVPATSGLRHVCVTKDTIGHKWFTLDQLPDTVTPDTDAPLWHKENLATQQ